MATEIERKWLILDRGHVDVGILTPTQIRQAYLSFKPTVRVRIADERGYITVKGPGGIARSEYEYEIPLADAREMLGLCQGSVVEKERYRIPYGKHVFELDVFTGKHQGLILVECELESENEPVELPPWLRTAAEVTGNHHYSNSRLAQA